MRPLAALLLASPVYLILEMLLDHALRPATAQLELATLAKIPHLLAGGFIPALCLLPAIGGLRKIHVAIAYAVWGLIVSPFIWLAYNGTWTVLLVPLGGHTFTFGELWPNALEISALGTACFAVALLGLNWGSGFGMASRPAVRPYAAFVIALILSLVVLIGVLLTYTSGKDVYVLTFARTLALRNLPIQGLLVGLAIVPFFRTWRSALPFAKYVLACLVVLILVFAPPLIWTYANNGLEPAFKNGMAWIYFTPTVSGLTGFLIYALVLSVTRRRTA
jgi:hypothetical protein